MKRLLLLLIPTLLVACGTVPQAPSWAPPVTAVAETAPVATGDDAADDPAIWVNHADPEASLIVGTNKKQGLSIYDLKGRERFNIAAGRMNNVDLREGFAFGDERIVLVAATNRSDQTLSLYRLDTDAVALHPLPGGSIATGFEDPYGLCLYRDGDTFHVFASEKEGVYRHWQLGTERGRVTSRHVRDISVDSQSEGCVADDALGYLYIAEEAGHVWKLRADGSDDEKREIARANERMTADFEGIAIYAGEGEQGYIVLSSQGNHTYAVFERGGDNAYVGSFAIVDSEHVDGSQETDGLDVVSTPLGDDFPEGMLVVQDGYNTLPDANQNFKLVSWRDVMKALQRDRQPTEATR